MEESTEYKRYIYISTEVKPVLEEYARKQKINMVMRFINEYNFYRFLQTELKNLNSIDYLIIDLDAIKKLTKDDEIVSSIRLIKKMYNLRIIIIAEGYREGNVLLGKLFNIHVSNFITANDDVEFLEELKITLSQNGMSFGIASKYQLDDNLLYLNQTTKVVKEKYVKVKQTVTIRNSKHRKTLRSYHCCC